MLLQLQNLDRVLMMQSELCKMLANPRRLRILHELRSGEKTVRELCVATEFRQANVSQQLALMRRSRVVIERRLGNSAFYHIEDKRIINACDLIQAVLLDRVSEDSKLFRVAKRR
jgi:ArsR family transcriptional regulator, virulence genes transcriptional regulator